MRQLALKKQLARGVRSFRVKKLRNNLITETLARVIMGSCGPIVAQGSRQVN